MIAIVRVALVSAFVAAAFVAMPSRVAACSCAAVTPPEALELADAAFVGTVVAAQPRPGDALGSVGYTFAVEAVARGPHARNIGVVAGGDGAACGISFAIGERWLIFANADRAGLGTHLCSGSVPLAPGERPALPGLVAVEPEPRPAPEVETEADWRLPALAVAAVAGAATVVAFIAFGRPRRRPPV